MKNSALPLRMRIRKRDYENEEVGEIMNYLMLKDEEVPVVYGPDYNDDTDSCCVDSALHHLRYLLNDLDKIKSDYFRLGFHLNEFKVQGFYIDLGYFSMEDFAARNLGLDKSFVSRCISVYKRFNASLDIEYSGGFEIRYASTSISKKFEKYSFSQLVEMVSMSDDDIKQISPDMSVKSIRDFKKYGRISRETCLEHDNVSQVATSQQNPDIDSCEALPIATSQQANYITEQQLDMLKGAALSAKVKTVDSIFEVFHLFSDSEIRIYDWNGKSVPLPGDMFEILFSEDGLFVIRLINPEECGDGNGSAHP